MAPCENSWIRYFPKMVKLSDYVMRFIADLGVKHVFLVPGGGAMHLNESLSKCREIQFVCNSHEQASAIAAEAYGKATNHLGVALVTTGPGGTNAVTGLAGAWLDSTPCLFVSGQVKRPDRMFTPAGEPLGVRQLGVQEIDITSIVRPLTKYAETVLDPQSIRYHLEKAVYLARNGRPGPVWIDIPLDVQASPIDEGALPGFDPAELPAAFDTTHLQRQTSAVIEALNRAERPLLFVGNGVRLARAEEELREILALLGIPVATTWCASDLVAYDDPLFAGRPGSLAARGANFALQNCDFLLILGARMDFAITGYAPDKLARAAYKAMVDIDAAEIAKLGGAVHNGIHADAKMFLREILRRQQEIRVKDISCWKKRCEDWKERYPVVLPEHRKPEGRVSIYHLAEILSQEVSPGDCVVSGSSGSGIEVFLFAWRSRVGQRVFHTAGLGAMGFGLPASLGVCLASGGRRTVCVDGDGGFQFNIQELETIARLQLPVKFFVLNNEGYASIRTSQTNYFGAPSIGCDQATGLTLPDLRKVASAFGLASEVIETQADLRSQVRRVLETPGPVVCDVLVIPDEVRGPRLSSVQRPDGSMVSKPLEDLWPFLDRQEFLGNMIVPALDE
jgi:acetolactate synthase I/II/III large subunit